MEIQIRVHSTHGPAVAFDEAVRLAGGTDPQVNLLYATPVDEAGEPVFGLDVELYARRIRYGQDDDATVCIGGIRAHSPEVALIRIAAYQLAATIAAAANAAAASVRPAAQV